MMFTDATTSRLLDFVFGALEDMVVVRDAKGRVVMSNLAARNRPAGEALAEGLKCYVALLGLDGPCDAACPVERVRFGAAQNASMEVYDERRGRTFEVRAFALPDGHTLEMVRDVSERRRVEEARLHAERRSAVDALAATVAHEARNPLNSAGLQLRLLERGLEKDGADPLLRGRARAVREELQRLERLMGEFIDFARPLALRTEAVDPRALLDRVRRAMAPQADEAGVGFEVECAADAPAVPGDAQRIEQALGNLVVNALEASSRGGRVAVKAGRGPMGVRLEVLDEGPGISAEDRRRLFELFFTTKASGTGLGLAIARKIVDEHRGLVTWENRPGVGAVFRIDLPLTPERAETGGA